MLGRIFRSLMRLGTNADALADTFAEANTHLRARLGLDELPPVGEPLNMLPPAREEAGGKRRKGSAS